MAEKFAWLVICAFFIGASEGSLSASDASITPSQGDSEGTMKLTVNHASQQASPSISLFVGNTAQMSNSPSAILSETRLLPHTPPASVDVSGNAEGLASADSSQPQVTSIRITAHVGSVSYHVGSASSSHVAGGMSTPAVVMTTKVSVMPPSKDVKICFMFVIREPWEDKLADQGSDMFKEFSKVFTDEIESLFADSKFDLKDVTFENFTKTGKNPRASLCGAFGPEMSASAYVDETFAKLAAGGKLGGLEIDNKTFKVEFRDVTISKDFKAKDGQCKKVCCGMGGPFQIEKVCSPSDKCRGLRLTEGTTDCLPYCSLDDCESSGNIPGISKAAIVLHLVLAVWFMFSP